MKDWPFGSFSSSRSVVLLGENGPVLSCRVLAENEVASLGEVVVVGSRSGEVSFSRSVDLLVGEEVREGGLGGSLSGGARGGRFGGGGETREDGVELCERKRRVGEGGELKNDGVEEAKPSSSFEEVDFTYS